MTTHGDQPEGFIPPHGGFADLICFQKSRIVYDGTFIFCERFLQKRDRTYDQMLQSARSGKQNIVEGSRISGTSKEGEIKLTGVARGSLEELGEDYRDYLSTRRLSQWEKGSKEALFVRRRAAKPGVTTDAFREFFETRPAEVVANIQLCLIHQAMYLLNRLIARQERDFLAQGGLRERMLQARLEARRRSPRSSPPTP